MNIFFPNKNKKKKKKREEVDLMENTRAFSFLLIIK